MFEKGKSVGWLLGLVICSLVTETQAQVPLADGSQTNNIPGLTDEHRPLFRALNRWSFQAGVGWITGSTVDEILAGDGKLARNEAEGEIYLFQMSYKLARLEPTFREHRGEMDIELPVVLGVVDERGHAPFMQYSAGVTLRWKTFPWNRWLYTALETGVGFTYSAHVLATERQQHPNRERSHVEFYWPIQLIFAHPRYRQHQFVLFDHHHSGGLVFHKGGANTLGVGYRYDFGERRR